jgi:multiple sugar transport system permease protein
MPDLTRPGPENQRHRIRPLYSRPAKPLVFPILLLAPAVVLFAVFVIYPILKTIALSFYSWNGLSQPRFVGFANYRELAADPVFLIALTNSLLWLAAYMAAPVLGLGLALLTSQQLAPMRLIRAMFFLPYVISQAVIALVFGWFLNSEFGLLNALLHAIGLPSIHPLESERFSILAAITAGLWLQAAYCMMLYLAGLSLLDRDLIAAARLDNIGALTLFRKVIAPQLRPATFIVLMVTVVGALRNFDLIAIMTLGGPYDSSTVLAYFAYEQAFSSSQRLGYAAAISTVLFAMVWGFVGPLLLYMLASEKT